MQTVQLSEIQCYLATGLLILREGKIVELCGLERPYKTNDNYFIKGETKAPNGTYRQTMSFIIDEKSAHLFKPLVIPLSELTKEDLENTSYSNWELPDAIKYITRHIHEGFICISDFNYLLSRHYDVFD